MQIGVFAKTFAGDTPLTVFGAAKAAGFAGVQYNMACSGLSAMPDSIPQLLAVAVKEASNQTGQSVFAVSGTYNMIHPDPVVRSAGLERLAVMAASCNAMGTGLITLCTGSRDAQDQWRHHPDNGSPDTWRELMRSFETAVTIADRHDILLGVEPELANVISSAAVARRMIAEIQSDRLHIIIDPANLFERADAGARLYLVEQAVDLLADHIVMAHAKDRAPNGGFATAGKGVIDFGHFLSRLKASGFVGPIVAHGLTAGDAAGVSAFLHNELQAICG